MSIEFKNDCIYFSATVEVEQAEPVLAWLQENACCGVDFSHCAHIHPAVIQVLLSAGLPALRWPENKQLAMWLKSVMQGD